MQQKNVGGIFGLLFILLALAAGIGGWVWSQRPKPVEAVSEVSVLVARTNTTTWRRIYLALKRSTEERGLPLRVIDDNTINVELSGGRKLQFKQYRTTGWIGQSQALEELCQRPNPPIAVIGGNNSGSAMQIAETLANQSTARPVFVLTFGTLDEIVQKYPDRTFRFGHPNSRQARDVVAELKRRYELASIKPTVLPVSIIKFKDSSFACDFADRVNAELEKAFGKKNIQATEYTLPSATGGSKPSELEVEVCQQMAEEILSKPMQPRVMVLPVASDAYRRLAIALHETIREQAPNVAHLVYENLTVLAGDSLDFVDFNDRLKPDDLHAAVIFFAQYDPRIRGTSSPDRERMQLSLFLDIADVVVGAADSAGALTEEDFHKAMKEYRRQPADPTFFENNERRNGGSAVWVKPDHAANRFWIKFPSDDP